MDKLWKEWARIRSSSLTHNTGWMIAGSGLGYVLVGIYFVILARLLGAVQYGVFVGAFAFVDLAARYSTLGTGTIFLRYVSIDRNRFALYWGNLLLVATAGGLIVTTVVHLAGRHLLNPASAALVMLAALANCFGTQITIAAAQVFQAVEQMRITAALNLLTNFLRTLAAVVLMLLFHRITAWQWALASTVVSLTGSVLAVNVILIHFGKPQFSLSLLRRRLLEGIEFAFANSTTSAYNDLDKVMLSHYGMNAGNGIYTLAYRAIDIAGMPVGSLKDAAMPRLFRKGAEGLSEAAALARRLWRRSIVFSLVLACGMFLLAPLVPYIAGHSFAETAVALRWLCLIPVFRSLHTIAGSALTGAGLQRYRTATQVVAVVLNILLNLWLIPIHGWRGAAWASLATDGALGVMNWGMLKILVAQSLRRTLCQPLNSSR
jgi:O-antigen/teichoic acid export membrane protein